MKATRFIGLFLVVSFVFLSVPISSATSSNISTGKVCKNHKQKVFFKEKSFTCIKSGKKFVWSKGIPSVKTAVTPVVVPTPNPSSSNIDAPAPTKIPVALWQETQFKILDQLKNLQPNVIQELEFILSPNADKAMSKILQDSYQEPITYLSNLYVNPAKVTFLVMNENDREWWLARFKELSSNTVSDWWGGSHCQVSSRIHCGYGSSPNPDGTFHFGQLLGSEMVWRDRDFAIAYHEAIHVYQLGLMGNRMGKLPSWFAEGQANYLGFTFSHRYIDSRLQRESEIWRLKSFPNVEKFNDSEWFEWLKRIDSDQEYTFKNQLGYSAGALILESLYNQHDYRKIHDWMVAIKKGSDYRTGFKSTFGEDYDLWMRDKVAPYLNSQI